MDKRKKLAAGAVAVAAVGVGSFFAVNAASAAHSIQASASNPVYWLCHNDKTGATQSSPKRYDGSGRYPGCGKGYTIYYWNQRGPAGNDGSNGSNGTDAQLTVQAQVALVDRGDSGRDGTNWALDKFTRTITLTRDHEVAAAKCGTGAENCWAYFGIEQDSGTFKTIDGAHAPESSDPISGSLSGTASGSQKFEFYADSPTPDATNLPASETGNDVSSVDMPKQLFASGTRFSAVTEPTFGYDYVVTSGTCEQWHDGSTGDTGDIKGANLCTVN